MSEDLSGFSLIDLFRVEAENHTATLSTGLLALESGKPLESADIEPLMRAAHSIKGAARIVGLDAAVRIAHVMEDCFFAIQKSRRSLSANDVDHLLSGLDLLKQISELPEAGFDAWTSQNQERVDQTAEIITAIAERPEEAPAPARQVEPSETAPEPAPPAAPIEPPPTAKAAPAEVVHAPISAASTATSADTPDRVVRVTAVSLTRLMSLAGESLVQSRQLRPFVDSLLTLRTEQSKLLNTLQSLQERLVLAGLAPDGVELDTLEYAKTQATECALQLGEAIDHLDDYSRRGEDLSTRLHHEVRASRMRPIGDGLRGFPRLVRDLARQLGKQVTFEVIGENTGVDRDILEKLEAPLNHLIRNSLDHGLETPDERKAVGKSPTGSIRLEARHRAGMLQILLGDDGRGIDPEKIRGKVISLGLSSNDLAMKLNEAELLEFLFLPGFSTKSSVTEISGRGVGLDVVQSMVREVSGIVRVTSKLGKGSRFTLELPITMSVIRALLVEIADEPYAFPLNRIERILRLPSSEVQILEGRRHFVLDGEAVGLVDARQVFELSSTGVHHDKMAIVVAGDRTHRFGLIVDSFLGERDLEVRPLDPRLGKVPNLNSAAILEDGRPVLIFDVEDLVRSIDNLVSGRRMQQTFAEAGPSGNRGRRQRILVVDDSITVREVERQILEAKGYHVEIAVDGLDGWNTVRSGHYDLVISDVDMPRMDGIQFVTRVKQDIDLRQTPVIIVSYKDREEDRMRGLDAGANAYLTKSSFKDETFLQTVVDLIGEPNA